MAATVRPGPMVYSGERDDEGHRTYTIVWRVEVDNPGEGPASVMNATGLAAVGSQWSFTNPSGGSDTDIWAFCTPFMSVSKNRDIEDGSPIRYWNVTQRFTTRPLNRCQDQTIENPLLIPQRVSGSFVKYTKEIVTDKDGNYVKSSSHEQIRGPQVEFDHNRPTVRIEQNVPVLQLSLFTSMIDTVNTSPLWGLPARTIKLSNASWERKWYGTCNIYYTRTFEFDVDFSTFDRTVLDEGTKALNGDWATTPGTGSDSDGNGWILRDIGGSPPDKTNPSHFNQVEDRRGENMNRIILDGNGEPWNGSGSPGTISIKYYSESNFLLLGIPTSF